MLTYSVLTKRLESPTNGVRLLNVYEIVSSQDPDKKITRATVFIPNGKQHLFLKKITDYADEEKDTRKGNPKNEPLMQSISNMHLAVLESFWRDDLDLLPMVNEPVWCEIWLSSTDEDVERDFRDLAESLEIEVNDRTLRFPERCVLLALANNAQLTELLQASSYIAEFRRAKESPRFFLDIENREQAEWAESLSSRLNIPNDSNVSVCILDTGVNNGHLLLKPLLSDEDCHTVDPNWGVADRVGHGTWMSGLATYGDLTEALQGNQAVTIRHRLESVKILDSGATNDPELYGNLTIQGISRAEITAKDRKRINCLAITSEDGRDNGKPTSWSAAIDQVTAGADDGKKRLVIIAAGNVDGQEEWKNYPLSNMGSSVQDPAQAWNALTVGAYTTKAYISDPDLKDYVPVAQPATLSPYSSTSYTWEPKWPIKPEIVMEGGNILEAPDDFFSEHEDLSLLTTNYKPHEKQFEMMYATSAATALASRMAAQIQSAYPNAWPETIRGLLVHSAEWTNAIKQQFCKPSSEGVISKTEVGKLLRICGYGVPDREKALTCMSNSLTLVSESELQPYHKVGSTYPTKDMHVHTLPWPKEELLKLGEVPVKLRITLSYFIEPGPGEIGWKDRYRYPSYALRFGLNRSNEEEEDFVKRINKAAREEDEVIVANSGSDRWLIGANGRNTGSIHSDIWKGTAADIASCNLVGVYPIIGWWRERYWLNCWDRMARYSLIVSIETPLEEVDI
jgi:hypothetical protein